MRQGSNSGRQEGNGTEARSFEGGSYEVTIADNVVTGCNLGRGGGQLSP